MPTDKKNPSIPENAYVITNVDKVEIQKFGREIVKFITGYASKNAVDGRFPVKWILGGVDYFTHIHAQSAKAIGDDLMIVQKAFADFNLAKEIDEPFEQTPEPTPEEAASIPASATAPAEPMKKNPIA